MRRITKHGVTLIGGSGFYTTEDGRYEISVDNAAVTFCDAPHPMRDGHGYGHMCPGNQEHPYMTWNAWDTVTQDHIDSGETYDTMDDAVRALAQLLREQS